jgi:deoxyribodipyrimidine photolyase-related protein
MVKQPKRQIILYDQLNTDFLLPEVDWYLLLYTTSTTVQSPYGPLRFHPKARALTYAAMRAFADELQESYGTTHTIVRQEATTYSDGLQKFLNENGNLKDITLVMMESSEPYHQCARSAVQKKIPSIQRETRPNTQFLLDHSAFVAKFATKPPIMETFYRRMRKTYNVLLESDGKPLWWKWNFDKENRKFDKKHTTVKHPTYIHQYYAWESFLPITRTQALEWLQYFVGNHLEKFGHLEDAMYTQDDMVYHSLLSSALNMWLLRPQEVIEAIAQTTASLNNKEWYIRQILWWREYMYHWFMSYHTTLYTTNHLNHHKPLPQWFWWPEYSPLKMHCVNHTLNTVSKTWYSHHISRLMVIGNFCLLAGYNPHDVNKWFWEMYTDAYEWVVTPNVLGMSQYADGGKLATKPYIASANYINGMSDYCAHCFYDPKIKSGPNACPLNYLYRNFVDQHQDLFTRQPYITKHLNTIDREKIRQESQEFLMQLASASSSYQRK